jgi:hypothetical protein
VGSEEDTHARYRPVRFRSFFAVDVVRRHDEIIYAIFRLFICVKEPLGVDVARALRLR